MSSRSGRAVALLLVPVAVVVAAVLFFMRVRLEPPTVPPYAVVDGGPAVLAPGGRFEMVVAPVTPVTGAVWARGFLLQGDTVRAWDPPVDVRSDGSVHVDGPVDRLFAGIPAGDWEAALAVGRPETLPTAPADVLRARTAGAGTAAFRLVLVHVRLAQ